MPVYGSGNTPGASFFVDGNWPSAPNAEIIQQTDQTNVGTWATYIVPGSGKRLFIGDSTRTAALSLRYCNSLESVPSFSTTDIMTWGFTSTSSHVIGRTGTDVRTHSSGPSASITYSVKTDGNYGGTGSTNVAVRMKLDATGIGFFGVTPVAKPSVTGSRASGAALVSLLSALSTLGLIDDNTTA